MTASRYFFLMLIMHSLELGLRPRYKLWLNLRRESWIEVLSGYNAAAEDAADDAAVLKGQDAAAGQKDAAAGQGGAVAAGQVGAAATAGQGEEAAGQEEAAAGQE